MSFHIKIALTILLLVSFPAWVQAQTGVAEMNSWIEGKLASDNTTAASFLFLFLGGLLASLLPCVYPLYPITANVIKARGSNSNRFVHPLFYFLGMAAMYLVFGIIASISGGAFNQVMRLPDNESVMIGICDYFDGSQRCRTYSHSSMFGGQTETSKKGVVGTFLLGMGAGLLASSCVGPVVVSISDWIGK
jgi:thiol:disulfide interchange protein DsbD